MNKLIVLLTFLVIYTAGICQEISEMKTIKGGIFVPLYGSDSSVVTIHDFQLDVYPVTKQQYLEFVKSNPKWKKSNVIGLFADKNYLFKWKNDTTLGGDMLPMSAATTVSWFAAKDYCACQGKRLPTIDEWEYAAMANETTPNAQLDSSFNQKIIEGYELPKTYKKEIGSTFKNYWGIYDMHGLVWEWTSDFNSVLISGESRQDVDNERNLFCGSAAINATNLMDYAAFMRYAFRGSVKAKYSILTLGFRCAKSIE
jgi:formylglycine-generating enzyme